MRCIKYSISKNENFYDKDIKENFIGTLNGGQFILP